MSYPSTFTSVFARNCRAERIDAGIARPFLEANHRYGWSRCRHCYGLYIDKVGGGVRDACGKSGELPLGTLVGVATFSNARRWTKGDKVVRSYEWVRYASLEGVRIQGGMGKLMNAFIEDVDPDDIMSYAPLENGDEGSVYRMLGFTEEGRKEFPGGVSLKFRRTLR